MWLLHQHCSCAYVCLCSCVGKKNAKSPRVVIVTSPGTALYPRAGEAERQPVLREEERALLQHFWNCSFQQCIYPPSNHLFIPTSSTISCFLSLSIGNITLVLGFTISPPSPHWSQCVLTLLRLADCLSLLRVCVCVCVPPHPSPRPRPHREITLQMSELRERERLWEERAWKLALYFQYIRIKNNLLWTMLV